MATINSLQNNTQSRNTGLANTYFDPKNIKGAIIVPKGYTIASTDLATLQTKLQADIAANNKLARIYPIANFVDFKDGSEKVVKQTFGYGVSKTVRDGAYTWTFQFTKGGHTLLQALRAFNGDAWDLFFVDSKNLLMGAKFIDPVSGALGCQAIPSIDLYTEPFVLNDGKKVADYMINFSFFPEYLNEQAAFISDAAFPILDTLKGLKDLNISGVGSATPGTYRITIQDGMFVNMYGNIANLSGAGGIAQWVVTNKLNGGVIPITSITLNPVTQTFDFALPVGNANYPTGTGGDTNILANLVGPTALVAAAVGYYESTGAATIAKN